MDQESMHLQDTRPDRGGFRGRILSPLRDAILGVGQDFTSGSITRAVTLLAIPMILEMTMESVFAVVDAFFVARLGSDALATVGLAEAMLTLIYAIAIGLSMGTTAMVARRIGEKKPEEAATVAVQAIILGAGTALFLGVLGFTLAPQALRFMGATDSILSIGSGYATLLFGSNIVIMLLFLNNAVFRGAGDASIAMRALWLANGINLVLDPCLIFGLGPFPELGLTGAAVATTCGRGTGVLYQFWMLGSAKSRIVVGRRNLRLRREVILRLIRLSASGTGQWLIATSSWVVLVRIVSTFGSAAVAGYTLAIRIVIFALLPGFGISNAAATLVGQNLGAGKPERAEKSVWITGLYTMVFFAAVTVLFWAAAEPMVRLFTDDPTVLPVAVSCLRIISYGYIFYAWGMVMVQAFNGAGDMVTPLWVNLICFWIIEIPLATVLAKGLALGPNGVFWAVAASESVLAVVGILLFRRGTWKRKVL
jgi:putative MATE family efflux protein